MMRLFLNEERVAAHNDKGMSSDWAAISTVYAQAHQQRWLSAAPLTYVKSCGCAMHVIACIEDPVVIKAILVHLESESTL